MTKCTPMYGFTLLELVVVLSLVGLLLTVVAPVSISTLEKSEAKTELLSAKKWLKQLSYQAYISSNTVILKLNDNQVKVFSANNLTTPIQIKEFLSLSFPQQTIFINSKGVAQPTILEGRYRSQIWQLSLTEQVVNE